MDGNCPLMDEWIRMQHMYIMEYHSSKGKNEAVSFAATRTNLKGIVLSEISQKDKHYDISYM